MEFEHDIQKIHGTASDEIADCLNCSTNMARKFKTGFSGLSNEQATSLKVKLELNPEAFNSLYLVHPNRTKETSNKAIING